MAGGQTGVDQAALEVAHDLELDTGLTLGGTPEKVLEQVR